MEFLGDVAAWFTDPANWTGRDAIPLRTAEHVMLSGISLLVGVLIALPLGVFIGHTGRWAGLVVAVTNAGRAVPSVGVLGIAYSLTLPFIAAAGLRGIGTLPTLIALTALAIPPIVVNAYIGVRDVERDTTEAARGMGMRDWQVLRRVELPLALPVILAGIRTASVQVIATATLGAIISAGGLGQYIVVGFAVRDFPMMFAGSLLVVALALTSEALFALAQRAAVSPGLRRASTRLGDTVAGLGL
ncbi:MAG TPA: ABC transporter permease [Candidatus Limnocylindria bacterium]|jgi:osmoprotectant transport system permease protein